MNERTNESTGERVQRSTVEQQSSGLESPDVQTGAAFVTPDANLGG